MVAQRPTAHLSIQNKLGSVEHYYHFLLGFLLPLVNYRYFERSDLGAIYVRSCGIMDRHIASLRMPGITVLEREHHTELSSIKRNDIKYVSIDGWDSPLYDFSRKILRASNKMFSLLGLCAELDACKSDDYLRLMIINRMPSDPFYRSERCEVKNSGSGRRSLPNFDDLVGSLSNLSPTVVSLEGLSLEEQIVLFKTHSLIIAQHGAALANIVFCHQGARVIEICPQEKIDMFKRNGDFFRVLSYQMKCKFSRLVQEHSHAEVEPNQLVQMVQST